MKRLDVPKQDQQDRGPEQVDQDIDPVAISVPRAFCHVYPAQHASCHS